MMVTRSFSRMHVDADRGGGFLVLGDRLERLAADAAVDALPDQQARPSHSTSAMT